MGVAGLLCALLFCCARPVTPQLPEYAPQNVERQYCETEVFRARCRADQVIYMTRADYGRMETGRCVDQNYGFVGCNNDVTHLADRMCSGRQNCTVPVPNSSFRRTSPCPKDLKPYFQASYECVAVELAEGQACNAGNYILPSGASGLLSSRVTMETRKGSELCPWMIQVRHGQHVNITLHDFAHVPASHTNDITVCHVYAIVRERSKEHGDTICSGTERVRHVYTSVGHAVEVRILGGGSGAQNDKEYFVLQFDVEGCPDLEPPAHTRMEREDDVVVIVCQATGQKWRLVCVRSAWQGEFGNCTAAIQPTFGEIVWGNLFLPFEASLVIVIAIAIGIGIIVLAFGLICIRGRRRRRATSQHVKLPAPKQPAKPKRRPVQHVPPLPPGRGPPAYGTLPPDHVTFPPPPPFVLQNEMTVPPENPYACIADLPPPPPSPSPPLSCSTPPFPEPPPIVFANCAVADSMGGSGGRNKKRKKKQRKTSRSSLDRDLTPPPPAPPDVFQNNAATCTSTDHREARFHSNNGNRRVCNGDDYQFSMKIYDRHAPPGERSAYYELDPTTGVPYDRVHSSEAGAYSVNTGAMQLYSKSLQKAAGNHGNKGNHDNTGHHGSPMNSRAMHGGNIQGNTGTV